VLAEPQKIHFYRNADMNDLEKKLKVSNASFKIIVSDGMFSLRGNLAPLPDMIRLAEEHEAAIYLDDAHASGLIGETGQGTWEYYGVDPSKIDFKAGSAAKTVAAGQGGFIHGSKMLIDYCRDNIRHYIFGGAVEPAVAKAITTALEIIRQEPWRRQKCLENANYLRSRLNEEGFDTLGSEFQIVPILIGGMQEAFQIQEELLEEGYYIRPFHYPAAPRNKTVLRATITCLHEFNHVDEFVKKLCKISEKYTVARV
jgi:8-amino-7-oxononanoate synthase